MVNYIMLGEHNVTMNSNFKMTTDSTEEQSVEKAMRMSMVKGLGENGFGIDWKNEKESGKSKWLNSGWGQGLVK